MDHQVHAPMTGLETCFEDELSAAIPGWHGELEQLQGPEWQSHTEPPKTESGESSKFEEVMILGT